MLQGKRILVAPLDWGLGHATRCIPVIRALLDHGAVPVIGADNGPLALLNSEFPDLEKVRIPGVTIRYSDGGSQLWSMAKQFPAMIKSVRQERALFDRMRGPLKLDAVISDQRFGIRSSELPSVLITHQVFPFTPIAKGALRKVNLRSIAKFDRCWVMDGPEPPGLAGELSHGTVLPENAQYIGTQSRMSSISSIHSESSPIRYRIVAVISGPEPQRTLLDNILMEHLHGIEGEHLLVRGMPKDDTIERIKNLTMVGHMKSDALATALFNADMIVSRSGYTTLMDLVAIGRNALIIPTPGQEEQEYLGRLHARTGRFIVQEQNSLDLRSALHQITKQRAVNPKANSNLLDQAFIDLASLLQKRADAILRS